MIIIYVEHNHIIYLFIRQINKFKKIKQIHFHVSMSHMPNSTRVWVKNIVLWAQPHLRHSAFMSLFGWRFSFVPWAVQMKGSLSLFNHSISISACPFSFLLSAIFQIKLSPSDSSFSSFFILKSKDIYLKLPNTKQVKKKSMSWRWKAFLLLFKGGWPCPLNMNSYIFFFLLQHSSFSTYSLFLRTWSHSKYCHYLTIIQPPSTLG